MENLTCVSSIQHILKLYVYVITVRVHLAGDWSQVQGWVVITCPGSAQDKQGLFLSSPGDTASW